SCALAKDGINTRPANAAYVAARTDDMNKLPNERTNATHGKARRGFRRQTGRGGARGWLGPSRMPTGVNASAVSSGRTLSGSLLIAMNAVEGSAIVEAWARPRQHSCAVPADAGCWSSSCWAPPCCILGRHIAAQVIGAP